MKKILSTTILALNFGCSDSDFQQARTATIQEQGDANSDYAYSVSLSADSNLGLAAALNQRVSGVSFSVFAQCTEGPTSEAASGVYSLGNKLTFTLDSGCSNAQVAIKNVKLNYEDATGNLMSNQTIAAVGAVLNNQDSVLILEQTGFGKDGVFQLREKALGADGLGSATIGSQNVSSKLNSVANSYCSEVIVSSSGSDVTASFVLPESGSIPGTYQIIPGAGSVPASVAAATVNLGARSVTYKFGTLLPNQIPGSYTFSMDLVPNVGQPKADESCSADITVSVTAGSAQLEL